MGLKLSRSDPCVSAGGPIDRDLTRTESHRASLNYEQDRMKTNTEQTSFEVSDSRTVALSVLDGLSEIFELWSRIGGEQDFFEFYGRPMYEDDTTSGEKAIRELIETENLQQWEGEPFVPGAKSALVRVGTMVVACAYSIQAIKEETNSPAAWTYTSLANRWLGILQGLHSEAGISGSSLSDFAKKGANSRHAEHRSMKQEVFEWCDANMTSTRSISNAALAIAGKQMNISHGTACNWISEWKKSNSLPA